MSRKVTPTRKGLTVGRVLESREHLDGPRTWASARQTLGRPFLVARRVGR